MRFIDKSPSSEVTESTLQNQLHISNVYASVNDN